MMNLAAIRAKRLRLRTHAISHQAFKQKSVCVCGFLHDRCVPLSTAPSSVAFLARTKCLSMTRDTFCVPRGIVARRRATILRLLAPCRRDLDGTVMAVDEWGVVLAVVIRVDGSNVWWDLPIVPGRQEEAEIRLPVA